MQKNITDIIRYNLLVIRTAR